MEMFRVLQRQTRQQIRSLHFSQAGTQRVAIRTQHIATPVHPISRAQTRFLHTQHRSPFTRCRNLLRPFRQTTRRFASASESSTQHLSLSQRMKKLSREYGWSALGVYFLLTALDFPFCFLAVRLLGTDRIGHWEHVVVSRIKEWIPWPQSGKSQEETEASQYDNRALLEEQSSSKTTEGHEGKRLLDDTVEYAVIDHGYNEAEEANKGDNASIWTQLALAYAIHKSFIFIRVPLTISVTPKVVKTLRSWGWNIGKRPTKTTASPTGNT